MKKYRRTALWGLFAAAVMISILAVAQMNFTPPRRFDGVNGTAGWTNNLSERFGIASILVCPDLAFATNDTTTIRVYDSNSNGYILAQADAASPATNTLAYIDEGGGVGIERLGWVEVTSTYTGTFNVLFYGFDQ